MKEKKVSKKTAAPKCPSTTKSSVKRIYVPIVKKTPCPLLPRSGKHLRLEEKDCTWRMLDVAASLRSARWMEDFLRKAGWFFEFCNEIKQTHNFEMINEVRMEVAECSDLKKKKKKKKDLTIHDCMPICANYAWQ